MPIVPHDPTTTSLPEENSSIPEEEKKYILSKAYSNIKIIFDTNYSVFCSNVAGLNQEIGRKLKRLLETIYVFQDKELLQNILLDDNIILILFMFNRVYELYNREPSILLRGEDDVKNFLKELEKVPDDKLEKLRISFLYGLSQYIDNLYKKIDEYEGKVDELKAQFDTISERWNLSSFAKNFQMIAEEENRVKGVWLTGALISFVSAMGFVGWNVYVLASNDFQVTIEEILLRGITIGFLYILAYWLGRRYYICRSQEISYRHMAAVLKVYNIFKDSVNSEDEKNIIMTEMAHTIFSPPLMPNIKSIPNSDFVKILDLLKIINSQKNNQE